MNKNTYVTVNTNMYIIIYINMENNMTMRTHKYK